MQCCPVALQQKGKGTRTIGRQLRASVEVEEHAFFPPALLHNQADRIHIFGIGTALRCRSLAAVPCLDTIVWKQLKKVATMTRNAPMTYTGKHQDCKERIYSDLCN
jgi:hypothetical protein